MLVIGPLQELGDRDFPGGPVGKAPFTSTGGLGLIPGQGMISHATIKCPHAATKDPECHN